GMNEAGLTVGINNLTAADGRVGGTWPFVVRAMLREETLEAALEVLARAALCGGHNYLVMDAAGRGANVEAVPTARAVTALAGARLAGRVRGAAQAGAGAAGAGRDGRRLPAGGHRRPRGRMPRRRGAQLRRHLRRGRGPSRDARALGGRRAAQRGAVRAVRPGRLRLVTA